MLYLHELISYVLMLKFQQIFILKSNICLYHGNGFSKLKITCNVMCQVIHLCTFYQIANRSIGNIIVFLRFIFLSQ